MKIVVVGGGKMGLPLACMLAHRGACVTVCDIAAGLVDRINKGIDPHNEPELDRYLLESVTSGRLRASTDLSASVAESDAVVVLVPALLTPERQIELLSRLEQGWNPAARSV